MIKDKKIIISAVALAILLGAGAYGIGVSQAEEANQSKSLIEKIAEKFNLKKDDVKKIFDEDREERQKEIEERFTQMLDQAVSDGKLTEAQKKLIIEKKAELKKAFEANREAVKDLSREEMEKRMKAERESLEKWATDNGVDVKYLMGLGGHRGGHMGPKLDESSEK